MVYNRANLSVLSIGSLSSSELLSTYDITEPEYNIFTPVLLFDIFSAFLFDISVGQDV